MKQKRRNDWEPLGIEDFSWFLWEPQHPPAKRAWYHVLLPDGEEVSAMYQDDATWWAVSHGRIEPLFWRDAPYTPSGDFVRTSAGLSWKEDTPA